MPAIKTENFKRPEVLAPAGGMEHLMAAVRSGADAIYLGTQNFNARRSAQNFSAEDLGNAVSYCHARGVKVYITLNTLVFDREMPALAEEIRFIATLGVDGVIVQDLGAAALARQMALTLPLHASTQMTIHNIAGAKALERLGFTRVVLARELSAAEIGAIARETSLELEVFVHGALCMSVSGQCYLSAMLGGRSGNRGLCAQPCRLNFTSGGREYALSLKDLSLIPRMEQLKALGIAALKIEGRMKRPEYVAAAVTACREALSGRTPDMDTLAAVFSRSGFTDGYFANKRGLGMFGSRTKEDVLAASPVLDKIASSYREEKPLVPIDASLEVQRDNPAVLSVSDSDGHNVHIPGPVPEEAVKSPLTGELAQRSIVKTGGTPFYIRAFSAAIGENLALPVSAINWMRKEALEALEGLRGAPRPIPCGEPAFLPGGNRAGKTPALRLRFRSSAQIPAGAAETADKIILPIEEIHAQPELVATFGSRLIAELPLMVFPSTEDKLAALLKDVQALGVTDVIAGNLGTLGLAKDLGMTVHGDYSLNIINSYALQVLEELGIMDATLSFEMNAKQAGVMSGNLPIGALAYGHLPLMTFRNCPAQTEKGCGACRGASSIRDRLGNAFPIACRGRSYSQLLNMVPLWLADQPEALQAFDFITLYFTIEDAGTCADILRRYRERATAPGPFTRGLYAGKLQ